MGRLQGPCNRLRLRLLEHIMITITITRFLNVIDYDYDYIVNHDYNHDYIIPNINTHLAFFNKRDQQA